MAINIGLVVHDKINLQNAVDLAAYYAAQRQAEMLNVIAHTNYQIRQSWKLLNWRYYVLGTMGLGEPGNLRFLPHPSRPNAPYPRSDGDVWAPVAKTPVLCVTYQPIWLSSGKGDNACKDVNFRVQNIKIPKTIAPFTPSNAAFEALARSLQRAIAKTCTEYAGQNWLFGAFAYVSYMRDQQNRKELIRALARNLARPAKDILDLKGESVYEGAKKTFLKNLTSPNFDSEPEFEIFNSLEGRQPSDWLADLDVWFTLLYSDLTGNTEVCATVTKQLDERPGPQAWANLISSSGNAQVLEDLMQYILSARSIAAGDSRRISIGVEKNPWMLAYVGVRARSTPRQLFPPFIGAPVQIEARAFAQPFGGRIGPWQGSFWSRGASHSEGEALQIGPAKLLANGLMNSELPENLMPQYAKYPGDKLGLKSYLAQSSLVNQREIQGSVYDYLDITKSFGPEQVNDVLAYSELPASNLRNYEIAATAPDLFDITYYSIQPNFGTRYLKDLRGNRERLSIPAAGYPRGDLGSREPGTKEFSVQDQIDFANGRSVSVGMYSGKPAMQRQASDAFWFVRQREHLLTSWVHNDTYGRYFDFPQQRFGHCKEFDDKYQLRAPGSCLDEGGRTGYSVKIVSPELFRTPLPLGGPGQSEGLILNPPPENW